MRSSAGDHDSKWWEHRFSFHKSSPQVCHQKQTLKLPVKQNLEENSNTTVLDQTHWKIYNIVNNNNNDVNTKSPPPNNKLLWSSKKRTKTK